MYLVSVRCMVPLPLRRLPLNLVVLACVKHDLVRMSGCHARMALGPVVGYCVGKDSTIPVEARSRDRSRSGIESYRRRHIIVRQRLIKQNKGRTYSSDEF